jgi:SAM-dependent methyltransferase
MNTKKYQRYQDYVIRDGRLVGEFEEMYRDHADPWHQSTRESFSTEKMAAINLLHRLKARRVIEVGCGLGYFSRKLADSGVQVLGLDVAATAIAKASALHGGGHCQFRQADILDAAPYAEFQPEAVIMAEVTWYVLDKLPAYLALLRRVLPGRHLIHLLNTYPSGEQKYGVQWFSNLAEIKHYFGMDYLEWGEIYDAEKQGSVRTYFCARINEA